MNEGLYTKIKSSKGEILVKLEFENRYIGKLRVKPKVTFIRISQY